jgi:hypothetical protein
MVLTLLVFALAQTATGPLPAAQVDMLAVIDHYKKLKNITFTIVRHRDPTDAKEVSADRVYWNDSHHFQIDFVPWGNSVDLTSASMLSDDGIVDTLSSKGIIKTEKLDPGTDKIPVWELRGGFVLCWLMGGKTWDILTKPSPDRPVEYAYGPQTKWHDFDVKEIVITRVESGLKEPLSIYIDPAAHMAIGFEDVEGGQKIWSEIRDVHEAEKS